MWSQLCSVFPAMMDENFCIYEPKETLPSCLVSGSCFGHGDMCVISRHHFSCDHQMGRVRKVCTGGREDKPHSMNFGGIALLSCRLQGQMIPSCGKEGTVDTGHILGKNPCCCQCIRDPRSPPFYGSSPFHKSYLSCCLQTARVQKSIYMGHGPALRKQNINYPCGLHTMSKYCFVKPYQMVLVHAHRVMACGISYYGSSQQAFENLDPASSLGWGFLTLPLAQLLARRFSKLPFLPLLCSGCYYKVTQPNIVHAAETHFSQLQRLGSQGQGTLWTSALSLLLGCRQTFLYYVFLHMENQDRVLSYHEPSLSAKNPITSLSICLQPQLLWTLRFQNVDFGETRLLCNTQSTQVPTCCLSSECWSLGLLPPLQSYGGERGDRVEG